jgi:NADPH-dependent 2,4-dienoyl-CoA reductase/sulfur reductase-like enzyme
MVTRAEVDSFAGNETVSAVVLCSGKELAADLVVAGIGVDPEVELLKGSGLMLDDGVVVNEYLETNVPGVYAAGDVTKYFDVTTGKLRCIEHWHNAVQQGKHAADVMMGKREPLHTVPYFSSDVFDLSWEFWGDSQGAEGVIHRGDIDGGSFSAWWTTGNRVVAAFVMNRSDEERELAPEWIKRGCQVNLARLADQTRPIA